MRLPAAIDDSPLFYRWKKGRAGRYLNSNENYARGAGFDFPGSMVGKSDDAMPWRNFAEFFRAGDREVMHGNGLERMNVQEQEVMVDQVADISVTEQQLLDERDQCVGVIGYFIDITGQFLIQKNGVMGLRQQRFELREKFNNEYLTTAELLVFRKIHVARSAAQIAEEFTISNRTAETHINTIKLQAASCRRGPRAKGDIIHTAMRAELLWVIYDCELAQQHSIPHN